jgi:MFS family permease
VRSSLWRLPGMRPLVVMTVAGFSGYAVLLPVAPLWAVHGGAGTGGAGLVNGVLLLSTVLTQLLVPAALRRFGWGPVLTAGMGLLGVPAALYVVSDALGPVLALSALRGVGFGVLTVTGSAAAAALVGTARRGEAIGVYGLAVALPNLVLLPAGPWVADHVGFWVVFLLSALPLCGIPAALRLADELHGGFPELLHRTGDATVRTEDPQGAAYLRLLRPTALLTSVTVAGGAALTFVPQMADDELLAAAGLFVMGLVSALGRWRVGRLADRYGVQRFLWPLTVVTVVGAGLLAWSVLDPDDTDAGLLLAGLVVLGLAYGSLQNLTLVAAFSVVSRRHHNLASAVWNVGFDAGTGLGSVVVGVTAQETSFSAAFLVVAALAVAVLPLAVMPPRASPRAE